MTSLTNDCYDQYGSPLDACTSMLQGAAYAAFPLILALGTVNFPIGVPSWGVPHGSYALSSGSAQFAFQKNIPGGAKDVILFSCHFSLSSLPSNVKYGGIVDFRDTSNNVLAMLSVSPGGEITVRAGNNGPLGVVPGPTIATSSGAGITAQNWHMLEVEITKSTGALIVRLNDADATGVPIINASGLTFGTSVSGTGILGLLPMFSGAGTDPNSCVPWIKDIWVRDTSGTDTFTNSMVGDFAVSALLPSADTTVAGMTPQYRHKIGAGILDNTSTSGNGAAVYAAAATSTDLGAGDWTLEGFVRFKSLPTGSNKAVIWGKWDETNNKRSYELMLCGPTLNNGNLVFRTSTDGTAGTVVNKISYPWVADTDDWHHIAVVRASGELLLFVDGTQLGLPIADATTYFASTEPLGLGAQVEGTSTVVANTQAVTWYDEVRFTVGFARYTSNFSPTTVPFPRGSGSDPQWSDVVLLAGFDLGTVVDESGFARALNMVNGSTAIIPTDGPAVGVFSTIRKGTTLIDDTFIQASFIPAFNILTLGANAANNETVTVGTKTGPAAAVYTWKTALTGASYEVLIGADAGASLSNLAAAINQGAGSGTVYGTGTLANLDVFASGLPTTLPGAQMLVTANVAGTAGNSIASTETMANGAWTGATLAGGQNIPGPSEFHMDRPPPHTTLIYAAHLWWRALKSDPGPGSEKMSLVGPLGAAIDGPVHALTQSVAWYEDPIEHDPDTGGNITPSTIVGGRMRFTRTA